jgi:hypothetical protein
MKCIVLFYIIYLILQIKYVYSEQSYLRFRNSFLRIYIANNRKEKISEYTHKIYEKTKNKLYGFHQYTITKYYDMNLFYNTLTDDERDLIDAIISLCY